MKIKKIVKKVAIVSVIVLPIAYLYGKNRQLRGVISNQQKTIDGLTKEVQKMAYHLGKNRHYDKP